MYKLFTFANGLRAIVYRTDFVRSVTMGVWVGAGSSDEAAANNGISHFTEHMLFKGTAKRTAFQIAEEIDSLGAQINAFTTKECTCYFTKAISEHTEKCFEILSDIFFNSGFNGDELAKEKNVVLEEISMTEDTPDDLCHELLSDAFYEGSPLGLRILGTTETVNNFTADIIRGYMRVNYCPQNVVISIVGDITFQTAERLSKKYFADKFAEGVCFSAANAPKHITERKILSRVKQTEQSSLSIGIPGVAYNAPDSQAFAILNSVIGGGGMSSRLFQKIREERGLAYSVYSYNSGYVNNGMFSVYVGTNPKNVDGVMELLAEEFFLLKRDFITEAEFLRGKEQMKAAFIMGQESTSSLMNVFGKLLVLKGEIFDIDERLAAINRVTYDDVCGLIARTISFERACASYVGPDGREDLLGFLRG